ncbi:very short patch repair endonuclease [Bradyrhizobium sp. USDA 4011]
MKSGPNDPPIDPSRSALMSRVRGKNSKPEMIVRRVAHGLGYRFRLHRKDLPGSPDLVFPRLRKVVFVHGCFWHRHEGCARTTTPKTRAEFWQSKFLANLRRDKIAEKELRRRGWRVLVVWECETFDRSKVERKLSKYLKSTSKKPIGSFPLERRRR